MQKILLLASLLSISRCTKVPLKHRPLTMPALIEQRDRLSKPYELTALGDEFPLKDYMNT